MKLRNMYEGSIADAEGRWRVKVYQLNEQGKWDDRGTGHVSVDYIEQAEAVGLVVIDEKDNSHLLLHRISPEDIYHRQEDTIISWTDQDASTDLALSFQEAIGCACIWDQMNTAQRQIQFPPVGDDILHDGVAGDVPELPAVELANLPQIAKVVSDVSPFHRDRLATTILRDSSFFRKLLEMFRACEDLEDTENLGFLFKSFKGIILLNDSRIFDIIFSDDMIMDVVGALEYDPDIPNRQDHRGYLKNSVVFKEAVPIRDPVTKSKIHQTYRIGYIKDVILPRVLDDQTFSTLNSMMLYNNVEVVMALQSDSHFLGELFARLEAKEMFQSVWRDLVLFLQEFCNLGKHLQPVQRNTLFSSLISRGLFEIVTTALESSDESVRLSGTDILMASLNHDPASLRSFLVDQPNHVLFSLLVKGMLTPSEGGLQVQLLEMMRMLLDSETMEESETSSFLEVFYDKYIDKLVGALTAGCSVNHHSSSRPVIPSAVSSGAGGGNGAIAGAGDCSSISAEILNNICELLCFCVQHHGFRIKYYALRHNVVEKVLRLTRRREKYLVVAAVRFLRTCVGLKDEFYFRHLVKNNLFEPVISAFLANGNVYNLLNSAVLELVEYIRTENIKSLIVHLVDNHWSKLQSVDYVETFKQLKIRYEQVKDEIANPPVAEAAVLMAMAGRNHTSVRMAERMASALYARRIRDGSMDEDEEAYFNNDDSDDEEDTAATAAASTAAGGGSGGSAGMSTRLSAGGADGASDAPGPRPQVIVNGTPLDVPLRGAFGLVDYDDEDDEGPQVTATIHNGREGRVLIGPMPLNSAGEPPSSPDGEAGWVESATEEPLGKRGPETRDGPDGGPNPSKRRRKESPGTAARHEGDRDQEVSEDNPRRDESWKGSLKGLLKSKETGEEVRQDHGGAAFENHTSEVGNSRLSDPGEDCNSRGEDLKGEHQLAVSRVELRGDESDGEDNNLSIKREESGDCREEEEEEFPDNPQSVSSPSTDERREENCELADRESSGVGRDERAEECRSEEGQHAPPRPASGGDEVASERINEAKGAAGNGLARTCRSSDWEERDVAVVCAGAVQSAGHVSSDNKEVNNGTSGNGPMTGTCGTGNGPVSGKSSPGGGGIKGGIAGGGGIGGNDIGGLPGADVRRAETLIV